MLKGQFFLIGAILLALLFFIGLNTLPPLIRSPDSDLALLTDNIKAEYPKALNAAEAEELAKNESLGNFTSFTKDVLKERFIDFGSFWILVEGGYAVEPVMVTVGNFLDQNRTVNVTIYEGRQDTIDEYGFPPLEASGLFSAESSGSVISFAKAPPKIPPPCAFLGYCGDGHCCPSELFFGTCPLDCGGGSDSYCGDGVCDADNGETPTNCDDCLTADPKTCGDNICNPNDREFCSSCPDDCFACPPNSTLIFAEHDAINTTEIFPVSSPFNITIIYNNTDGGQEQLDLIWLRERTSIYALLRLDRNGNLVVEEIETPNFTPLS